MAKLSPTHSLTLPSPTAAVFHLCLHRTLGAAEKMENKSKPLTLVNDVKPFNCTNGTTGRSPRPPPQTPTPRLGTYHCIGVLDQFVLRHVVYLFRLLQQIPQEVLQPRGREGIEKIKEVKASGESLVPQYRIGKEIMLIDVARGFFCLALFVCFYCGWRCYREMQRADDALGCGGS